jgi:hypothetical protein
MKVRNLLLAILLSVPMLVAAQATEKTMLKSFNLDGKSLVRLELPGSVDVKVWEKPTIQIQITVSLPSGNAAMLNELANVGRYNLSAKSESDNLLITSDNMHKIIKIKGQDLKENITFQVFVPKDVNVKIFDVNLAMVLKK